MQKGRQKMVDFFLSFVLAWESRQFDPFLRVFRSRAKTISKNLLICYPVAMRFFFKRRFSTPSQISSVPRLKMKGFIFVFAIIRRNSVRARTLKLVVAAQIWTTEHQRFYFMYVVQQHFKPNVQTVPLSKKSISN